MKPENSNNFEEIELSIQDIKRGLNFPKKMNGCLAEEIGVHIGDGSMYSYINNFGTKGFEYSITSNSNEKEYVEGHLVPLMRKLYGLETKPKFKNDNTLQLRYGSKSLVKFKINLGLPLGKKVEIKIPNCIISSDFVLDFLRGVMDTDGTLCFMKRNRKIHYYPRLAIRIKSKTLILQIDEILKEYGFTTTLSLDEKLIASNGVECTTSRVVMNGMNNLKRWEQLIGFSNPKNIKKLEEWKEKGFIEKINAGGEI